MRKELPIIPDINNKMRNKQKKNIYKAELKTKMELVSSL